MLYVNRRSRIVCLASTFLFLLCAVFSACSDPPSQEPKTCPEGTVLSDDGECIDSEPACTSDSCERGVCDPQQGCVNADDCNGDASRCLAGNFCADDGSCQPDLCEQNQVECTRGVCNQTSGDCVDADRCESSSECLPGSRCLANSCTREDALCGEDGCSAGLVCDFDEETLSAECAEPTLCETSRDCFAGRVCAGEKCLSAPVCEPDAFEPNDTPQSATNIEQAARHDALDATLCKGDRDVYLLDVAQQESAGTRRHIHVVVEFARREVGLGPLTATLLTPDGETALTGTSDDSGTIDMEYLVPLDGHGTYQVVVEPESEDAPAGIHYRLVAQVQPRGMAEICETAPSITLGEPVQGDTSPPWTSLLESRCKSDSSSFTDVYAFEVEEAAKITAVLTADNPQSFVLGFRSDCWRDDTEWACEQGRQPSIGGANNVVVLDGGVLAPGSYFVLVHNLDNAGSDDYELELTTEESTCDPAQNSCTDLTHARTCSAEGSWDAQTCERGCQTHTGRCRALPAESCSSAPLITESTTVEIDWETFSSDYHLPEGACVPFIGGSTQSGGPDAVYQVSLPPNHALTATLSAEDARDVSVYVLEDCLAPSEHCLLGANEDYVEAEQLTYWNESDSHDTVFVVADSIEQMFGTAELDLRIEPLACNQNEMRCHQDAMQRCDEHRTGWTTTEQCEWGCTTEGCNAAPGDTCDAPVVMTSGQTFSGLFSDYASDAVSEVGHCGADFPGDDRHHDGPDVFFSVDLTQGELMTADVVSDAEVSLYAFEGCQAEPAASCLLSEVRANTLQFYAPQTATYFFGVDTTNPGATQPFDITVDVQSGATACQPGAGYCDLATDEYVVCNEGGTREIARYQCAYGCAPQGCQAPPVLNDTCASPYVISASTRFIEDLDRFTNDYDQSASCGINNSDGPDAVYEIKLAADQILFASAETTGTSDPVLYLASNCLDIDSSCKVGDVNYSGPSEIEYQAPVQETLYLVVDSRVSFYNTVGPTAIDIDIRSVECQHGQTRCAPNASGLDYCTELGIWEPYACAGSCTAGACDTPSGGICQDAIPVVDGQTVSGDFGGQNNVELGGEPGACTLTGAGETTGPDTFYRIDLQQGDLLEVDLQTSHRYASVHILDSCTGIDSCQPGTSYRAEADGPVWVMVDDSTDASSSANAPTFDLTFNVTPGAACTPSTWSCVDADTVGLCDAAGSTFEKTFDCPSHCARGGCQANSGSVDRCVNAPNVGDGIMVYADPTNLVDTVSFGAQSSCAGGDGAAPDLIYEITVGAHEVLYAQAIGAEVSLLDDCSSPDSSCIAPDGTDPYHPQNSGLYWSPEQTRTVKVVADVINTDQPIRLTIEKLPIECSEGTRSCAPSGDAVRLCEPYGLWRTTDCQTTCSNGRCDAPTGEYCEDAFVLSAGMSVAGDFGDFNEDVRLYTSSNCSVTYNSDAVYEIDLAQGDMLQARLVGPPSSSISVLDDCTHSVNESCRMSSYSGQTLEFVATETGTYYLVIDQGSSYISRGEEFALEVDVVQGRICQPDTRQCDPATNITKRCNADGTGYEQAYTCAHGCDGEVCARSSVVNDTCDSALAIDSSTIFYDTFDGYNDDHQTLSGCTSDLLRGTDSIYAISLEQNEMLRVDLDLVTNANNPNPVLYLADSCAAKPGACVAIGTSDYNSAELTYQAQQQETVYLVVDAERTSLGTYRLAIDIGLPECPPGDTLCVDSDTLQRCVDGRYEERDCPAGCSNAACNTPANNVCSGATSLPRDGVFHTRQLHLSEDYTDTVDVGQTYNTQCVSWATDGPDALYRIDAQAGDVLSAYWTDYNNLLVWLTDNCANAADHCFADSSAGFLEQTFSTAGTYWLIVDSRASIVDEPIELDVRLAPKICQPGQASCDPATGIISYCNEAGTAFKDYVCQGGCDDTTTPPSCVQPRGEECVDAIDATQGGTFTVDLNRFTNTFMEEAQACLRSAPDGGDAVYRVDLLAGQTVEATTQPPPIETAAVYILDACHGADPASACLAGQYPYIGQPATASYTATSDETVWVVLDGPDVTNPISEWTIDITVQ